MAERKGKSSGKASTSSSRARTTKKQPQKKPIRREVGAVVCLFLFAITLLSLFGLDAVLLRWVNHLFRGFLGAGVYVMPVVFLLDFVILMFHDGRPVRLRLVSTWVFAGAVGILGHLFGDSYIEWALSMVGELWRTGVDGMSGGVISGFLAMLLELCISRFGAVVLGLVLAALSLLLGLNFTIAGTVKAIRQRPRPVAYDPPVREHRDPAEVLVNHVAQRQIDRIERKRSKISDFDLPVDEPPQAVEEPPKKSKTKPVQEVQPVVSAPEPKIPEPKPEPIPEWITETVPEPIPALEPVPLVVPKPEPEPKVEKDPEILQELAWAEELKKAAEQPKPPVELPRIPETKAQFQAAAAEAAMPFPPIEQEPSNKMKKQEAQMEAALIASQIEAAEVQQKVYAYPTVELLNAGSAARVDGTEEMQQNAERLNDTLESFGIDAHIIDVIRGPSVTRYELELDRGVKLSKITNLADDIALALGASGVRISAIPDKISVVGVEVPNKLVTTVNIREVLDSLEFQKSKSKISFAVGKDISGKCIIGDIAKLPHMLIAGTTGSGKSVCMNSLIISLLYKSQPEEVRMIMVDPKMVELNIYDGIPHLLIPVVTDPKKAAGALQWAVTEMMKRYRMMADAGVRDVDSYNKAIAQMEDGKKLPQIVVIIDELADLMLVAAKEVEEAICRIAQMGRASGIHLVIATQRPSSDVITGLMKANIPSRIAFAVASSLESRIILDTGGAEKLVGRGDMLYAPLGQGKPRRVQGCFITDEEVQSVVSFIKGNMTAQYDHDVIDQINQKAEQSNKPAGGMNGAAVDAPSDGDELLPAAVDVFLETGQASVSMLQRRLKLGYARAARIVDEMEEKGIVGPYEGSKPRQMLVTKDQWRQMQGLPPEEGELPGEPVEEDEEELE